MIHRPWSVIVVALLFIIAGCIGFVYHFRELFIAGGHLYESIWVQVLRLLAILCGFFLLKGADWARWLALAWLLYHVFISMYHSTSEVITHIMILVFVTILLYLPKSNGFFRRKETVN